MKKAKTFKFYFFVVRYFYHLLNIYLVSKTFNSAMHLSTSLKFDQILFSYLASIKLLHSKWMLPMHSIVAIASAIYVSICVSALVCQLWK